MSEKKYVWGCSTSYDEFIGLCRYLIIKETDTSYTLVATNKQGSQSFNIGKDINGKYYGGMKMFGDIDDAKQFVELEMKNKIKLTQATLHKQMDYVDRVLNSTDSDDIVRYSKGVH